MLGHSQLVDGFATFRLKVRLLQEIGSGRLVRSVSLLPEQLASLLHSIVPLDWKKLEATASKWNSEISCAVMVIDVVASLVDDTVACLDAFYLQKLVSHRHGRLFLYADRVVSY